MISNRSYIVRALLDWVLDNTCTPYIVLSTESAEVLVPEGYSENNQIVLNISPSAVQGLEISKDGISFQSRFSGKAYAIFAPIGCILAIYAKETGEGMVFDLEEGERQASDKSAEPSGQSSGQSKKLSSVHSGESGRKPGITVEDSPPRKNSSDNIHHLRIIK